MEEQQIRILRRIVDEIDRHREGGSSAGKLFTNVWGLISAAEVDGTADGAEVESLYHAACTADDLRQPWMPHDQRTTDADVEGALERLRSWAAAL